jgi:hypothetical protein
MAEINFNNLYNQLSPMDKMFYDQQFQKKYNSNQENIMLSSQPSYEQMKSVYDAQQQVPEKSFFDSLNPFTSASAAEMPPVPNVSLGTPQINFNTGITGASNAIPMINNVPMINTGAIDQRLQNTDLVNQIIEQNQQKLNLANTADTAPFFFPPGGTTPLQSTAPLQDLGIDTSYGVANEEDVEQEFLPDQEPSGIAKLFEFLGKLPTPFNLARRGLGSLRGLNDRLQNSDFGRSKTLMDYLDARKYGGIDARDRAAQQNMREARAIQTQVDRRGDSTSRVADRNRSSVTKSSAAKSRGVGGGGYTASDSNRESYRGR